MNKSERQSLMSQYQTFLRSDFLPEEEKIKGQKLTQAEWEGHFNRLSSVFAAFLFCNRELVRIPRHDMKAILLAYGDHLRLLLDERWLEHGRVPSPKEQEQEREYYFWPVSVFIVGEQVSAENN